MIASNSDPTPCIDFIRERVAMAQQIQTPIEPTPFFFNGAQCGLVGGRLPDPLSPSNCSATGPAFPVDNCLRVIEASEFNETTLLASHQFNVLDLAEDGAARTVALTGLLYSWTVPPNYRIYFTRWSPATVPLRNNQVFSYGPGETMVNVKQLAPLQGTVPFLNQRDDVTRHYCPYLILVRLETMETMLYNMCTNQVPYVWGSVSLNTIWAPQSSGCDRYMNFVCAQNPSDDRCVCYMEQDQLNRRYGTSLNVPACCFGARCAQSELAYKTSQMLQQCCSFAVCQTVVAQTPALKTGNGTIECAGSLVQYPVEPVPANTSPDLANVSVSIAIELLTDTMFPIWVWICLGLSALLFVSLLITLSVL
jgi:hypothetical protein